MDVTELVEQVKAALVELNGKPPEEIEAFLGDKYRSLGVAKTLVFSTWFLGFQDPRDFHAAVKSSAPPPRVCGRVWKPGDRAYKCVDCESDASCAICESCFDPEIHKGHEYHSVKTGGGICDCGDPTAWKPSGFCRRHGRAVSDADPISFLPQEHVASCRAVVRATISAVAAAFEEPDMHVAIAWLSQLVRDLGEGFMRIVTDALVSSSSSSHPPPLSALVRSDFKLPKPLAVGVHQLFFQLLADLRFKEAFARILIEHYPALIQDAWPKMEAADESVLQFSVQLFTVPGLTDVLVPETGLFRVLFSTLISNMAPAIGDNGTYDPEHPFITKRPYWRPVHDVRYAVQLLPSARLFLQSDEALQLFLQFMAPLSGACPHTRRADVHVEYERNTWEKTTDFEINASPIAVFLVEALQHPETPPELRRFSTSAVVGKIASWLRGRPEMTEWKEVDGDAGKIRIVKYDVASQPISFHWPLHRICSMFIRAALSEGIPTADVFGAIPDIRQFANSLMEAPLRCLVASAQGNAGLWTRNGDEFAYQCGWWRTAPLSWELDFDPDIFALKLCAGLLPADVFASTFLSRFGCLEPTSAELLPLSVVEEALFFLVAIATGRWLLPGTDDRWSLRRELVNLLAVGDQPHSLLLKAIEKHLAKQPFFEEVLAQVATFVPPTSTEAGAFHLRDELWSEFDSYFLHWNRRTSSSAEDAWAEKAKKCRAPPTLLCPPPGTPAPEPFAHLPALLGTTPVQRLVSRSLRGEFTPAGKDISDRLLVRCLHVLEVCLREAADAGSAEIAIREALAEYPPSSSSTVSVLCKLKAHERHAKAVSGVLSLMTARSKVAADLISTLTGGTSGTKGGADGSDAEARRRRAKERQDAIVRQFREQQKAFLTKMSVDSPMHDASAAPPAAGGAVAPREEGRPSTQTSCCVLCREDGGELGLIAYAQRSSLVRYWATRSASAKWSREASDPRIGLNPLTLFLLNGATDPSVVVHSCSHVIHSHCFASYFQSLLERRSRHEMFDGYKLIDLDKSQFCCPACRRVSNALVPLSPDSPATGIFAAQLCNVGSRFTESAETFLKHPALEVTRAVAATIEADELRARGSDLPLSACLSESRHREVGLLLGVASSTFSDAVAAHFAGLLDKLLVVGVVEGSLPLLACNSFHVILARSLAGSAGRGTSPAQTIHTIVTPLLLVEVIRSIICFGAGKRSQTTATAAESGIPRQRTSPLVELVGRRFGVSTPVLDADVEACCQPFLRQVALLCSVLDERQIPEDTGFGSLASFVGVQPLPFFPRHFEGPCAIDPGTTTAAVTAWCDTLASCPVSVHLSCGPAVRFSLAPIPEQHTDMVKSVQGHDCPRCKTVPREPAICLICGEMLCLGDKCCRGDDGNGECNAHMGKCSGSGVFILASQAILLLLRSDSKLGTFSSCPYLDSHGEEDPGLLRGRPLTLSNARIQQLTRIISEHGVDAACSSSDPSESRALVWHLL